ncbi:hypothetical protein WJX72_008560 [[Myrmecia] bisecta]|uniref:Uncharacterized protein n=1 Tax=[Myrmecia] bisecta TaxID=41462 RepID=A0AAW1PPI6_9CHLO
MSEEGVIPRLVELVSEAQQASDEILDWAYSSMHLLLCMMYPDPVVGPSICRQSRQVFAAPSSSLLQALRFWWLQAAQAPTGAGRSDAASMAVAIVRTACSNAVFAQAWAATIGDELGLISNARAIQDSSTAQPPNVYLAALPSLFLLLNKDLGPHGEVLQASTEQGVLEMVHRPTLNVLLRSKGPLLVEAALRTACGEPVRASAAAWVLPTMLGLADVFLASNQSRPWLSSSAGLVALLAGTGALNDAIVCHLCNELACLAERPILSQETNVLHPMLSVHLLINITKAVVNSPADSASRPNARLEAVVQTGLLDLMCTQTSRVLAEKGIATFFGLLATDVLPAAASLLPVEVQTADNVRALTRPFRGLDLHEAVNSHAYKEITIAQHEKSKALAAMAELVDALEALCGPRDQTAAAAAADLELARMAALGPGCHNPGCKNVAGAAEAELPTRKCSAHYWSAACQKAAWKLKTASDLLAKVSKVLRGDPLHNRWTIILGAAMPAVSSAAVESYADGEFQLTQGLPLHDETEPEEPTIAYQGLLTTLHDLPTDLTEL